MAEQTEVFKASRWTRGNHLFPVRIEVSPDRVTRVKPRFFGSSEESISMAQVASVKIDTGFIWSTILHRLGGRDQSHHQPRAPEGRCPAESAS